ncbi:hypothetical protein ACJMK2_032634 [Sinanodonta woodiana]|uniref:Cytochrome P450 n=1 Tax=Sinanodonta woodiana TaxID=1069815 RepID=A0ABD3X689_SINWO
MTVWIITGFLIMMAIMCWIKWSIDLYGKPLPGPKSWSFIGTWIFWPMRSFHLRCKIWAEEYGPIFEVKVFTKKIVILNSVSVVRELLTNDDFAGRVNVREQTFVGKYLFKGNGVLARVRADDIHSTLRSILHDELQLNGERAQGFEERVADEIKSLTNKMKEVNGKDLELDSIIRNSVLTTLWILLTGRIMSNGDPDVEQLWKLNENILYLSSVARDAWLMTFPILRHLSTKTGRKYREAQSIMQLIQKRCLQKDQVRGLAHALLNARDRNLWMTDEQAGQLLIDIFHGGACTTVGTVLGLFICLVHHPDCQNKVIEEIRKNIGKQRKPSLKDKHKMPFTVATILETLRYTSIWPLGIPRKTDSHFKVRGFQIPKGSWIFINSWFIQHNPNVFANPWNFEPERFLDKRGNLVSADHPKMINLTLFGDGKRRCPGESLVQDIVFLYVTSILQKFRILKPLETDIPSCDPNFYTTNGGFLSPPKFACRIEKLS